MLLSKRFHPSAPEGEAGSQPRDPLSVLLCSGGVTFLKSCCDVNLDSRPQSGGTRSLKEVSQGNEQRGETLLEVKCTLHTPESRLQKKDIPRANQSWLLPRCWPLPWPQRSDVALFQSALTCSMPSLCHALGSRASKVKGSVVAVFGYGKGHKIVLNPSCRQLFR